MSDLIERMARAAYERHRAKLLADPKPGYDEALPPWDNLRDRDWWIDNQRAALAAAHEPTEAMQRKLAADPTIGSASGAYAACIWNTLIAAALSPAKQPA